MAEPATPPAAAAPPFALTLPDGTLIPINGPLTIGRGDDADVQIADPTVSRLHARVTLTPDGPLIEDAGSRYGTRMAGEPLTTPQLLRPGSTIRLGNVELTVSGGAAPEPGADTAGPATLEQPAADPADGADSGPGRTLVVPVGATLAGIRAAARAPSDGALRPRVRSGFALKRLGTDEGRRRYVLRDLKGGAFLRLEAEDAGLLELLDGEHTVSQLLGEAQSTLGPQGPGRLARLLADLGDRALLDGVPAAPLAPAPMSAAARALAPRERTFDGLSDYFDHAYRRWGRRFFSPLTVTFLALFALAGFAAFAYLIGARYGTPFVVAHRLIIGGAVFVLGRFVVVALHELAHGLALAHYGRRAPRGGLRLLLIFPYAFVDTSEAYFEPRLRRMVISAAGPVSDVSLGALFSFVCAALPSGAIRDVFFQLAFGAYVGAFFNLNPFLDRDGYHILVDALHEPGLRQRARHQFAHALSGSDPGAQTSSVLGRYAIAGVVWSAVAAAFVIVLATRYYDRLVALAPRGLILAIFIVFSISMFIPVLISIGMPMWRRARHGPAEVNRVLR